MINLTDFLRPTLIFNLIKKLEFFINFIFVFFLSTNLTLLCCLINLKDFQQGEYYRIIYIHVPTAWLALFTYICLALSSFAYLTIKHIIFDFLGEICAKLSLTFISLTIFTGILWGKPMWGVWWVWDARLTSVFFLFLIVLTYFLIRKNIKESSRNYSNLKNLSSYIALFGLINVPIIKFSVDWWTTLHQPASISEYGSTIHILILIPLLFSFLAFTFYAIQYFLIELKTKILKEKYNF